jgi:hypothetical protein
MSSFWIVQGIRRAEKETVLWTVYPPRGAPPTKSRAARERKRRAAKRRIPGPPPKRKHADSGMFSFWIVQGIRRAEKETVLWTVYPPRGAPPTKSRAARERKRREAKRRIPGPPQEKACQLRRAFFFDNALDFVSFFDSWYNHGIKDYIGKRVLQHEKKKRPFYRFLLESACLHTPDRTGFLIHGMPDTNRTCAEFRRRTGDDSR